MELKSLFIDKSSAPLQTRVGIATGLVVVGDLVGSGAAQEQAVVGETPTLQRVCKASPNRTLWWSLRAHEGCLAIYSNWETLGQEASRA
jgi:class 3 adenylate cyclase